MIRITKSQPAPPPLGSSGKRHRKQLEAMQATDPAACEALGSTRLATYDGIYNDARVKQQLRADQHDKCCYCESYFSSTSYGDVEHFRPKAGYQQAAADTLRKPGYYWLAYEWRNLYFACQLCNQRYKGNLFPLANPAERATTHQHPLAAERPLLPDPAIEDPAAHLTFDQDTAVALDERGEACIRVFGLDRPELIRQRLDKLKALRQAHFLSKLDMSKPLEPAVADFFNSLSLNYKEAIETVAEAKRLWEEAAFDAAEFAGMVRATFRALPLG